MKAINQIENAVEDNNERTVELSRTNLLLHFHPFADPCSTNEQLEEWVSSEYGFCKLLENGNFLIKEEDY